MVGGLNTKPPTGYVLMRHYKSIICTIKRDYSKHNYTTISSTTFSKRLSEHFLHPQHPFHIRWLLCVIYINKFHGMSIITGLLEGEMVMNRTKQIYVEVVLVQEGSVW